LKSADQISLFVKNQTAAPFTNPQPPVPAFVSLAALLAGSSFQTASFKVGCARFLTAIPAGAAFTQRTLLPFAYFDAAAILLSHFVCLCHMKSTVGKLTFSFAYKAVFCFSTSIIGINSITIQLPVAAFCCLQGNYDANRLTFV
jgi:hypothetical protein